MTKRKLTLAISLIAITIMIGGGAMHLYSQNVNRQNKQEELKRNREHEISLVKALKNSYTDIKKIDVDNPVYTKPPGDWGCTVHIVFNDGQEVKYYIGHNLSYEKNYGGSTTTRERAILKSKKGSTNERVEVIYSDGEKGEQ